MSLPFHERLRTSTLGFPSATFASVTMWTRAQPNRHDEGATHVGSRFGHLLNGRAEHILRGQQPLLLTPLMRRAEVVGKASCLISASKDWMALAAVAHVNNPRSGAHDRCFNALSHSSANVEVEIAPAIRKIYFMNR